MAGNLHEHDVGPSQEAESLTESIRSRHSSIRGPYRAYPSDSGFPLCNLYPKKIGEEEIFSRCLLSIGEGYPLWRPLGYTGAGRSGEHYKQGLSVGDVIYLNARGSFDYLWNIFHPQGHALQTKELPRNFCPIQPSLEDWQILRESDHYAPGSTLVSEGIQEERVSTSSLQIKFKISTREGGILVLPNGASREDLIVKDVLYDYLREHAIDWYQSLDHYDIHSSINRTSNGTLYIVTGTDKTRSWGMASFPSIRRSGKPLTIHYNAERTNPWMNAANANTTYRTEAQNPDNQATFMIRGLRLGLSGSTWERKMAIIDPTTVPVYNVYTPPTSIYQAILSRIKAKVLGPPNFDFEEHLNIPYHPSNFIMQLLFDKSPNSIVAIVDDRIWCSALNGRNLTYPELLCLMKNVFNVNDVVTNNDTVMLVVKSRDPADSNKGQKTDKPDKTLRTALSVLIPGFLQTRLDSRAEKAYIHRVVKFLEL